MQYSEITKPWARANGVEPNMVDYTTARSTFSWEHVKSQLAGPREGWLNIAHEAIDRHCLNSTAGKIAMHWEGKDGTAEVYTFSDLQRLTNRFANVITGLGLKKGDRVFTFLERLPEIYVAAFGTLKAGCVVGPLFSAFGPDPVRDRLLDSGAKVLVTSPELKHRIAPILKDLPELRHIIVVNKNNRFKGVLDPSDIPYERAMESVSDRFDLARTTPDDYSIMHYTSGTTGKPKGAVHAHSAVLGHYATGKWVLDLHPGDVYWCTADPGWVTGTSYGMSAPWTNGVTQLIYEGGFKASAWYSAIEKYKVTVWYTAPTAIRMLMKAGADLAKRHDLSSLRHVCSVGEPLNPEAVVWGLDALGLPIHDNWWQTETGAILIANYPVMNVRPGSMGRPFPGIVAGILDEHQQELPPGKDGHLAIRPGWPSMFRGYWGNPDLYKSRFVKGWYITGDKARMDEDGYVWFVGRADDVINTAGHLVGPFEVESALIEHPAVAEAGVIGKPDPVAMEVVKAFVALKDGQQPTDELRHELYRFCRQKLAAAIAPREIEFVPSLPKTRSGKIMRRLLKARELGLPEGDTSTLEED